MQQKEKIKQKSAKELLQIFSHYKAKECVFYFLQSLLFLKQRKKKWKKGNRTVKQEAIKYQQALRSAPSSVAMASREACVR